MALNLPKNDEIFLLLVSILVSIVSSLIVQLFITRPSCALCELLADSAARALPVFFFCFFIFFVPTKVLTGSKTFLCNPWAYRQNIQCTFWPRYDVLTVFDELDKTFVLVLFSSTVSFWFFTRIFVKIFEYHSKVFVVLSSKFRRFISCDHFLKKYYESVRIANLANLGQLTSDMFLSVNI